jgi:hypothetical protein
MSFSYEGQVLIPDASFYAVVQMRKGAVSDHAHVPRGQAHRAADVVRVAFVDEGREDYGARSRLEPLQALIEARAIGERRAQLIPLGQRSRGGIGDASLTRVVAPHIHHHVSTRPEDVRVEVVDLFDAAGAERLQNGEQDLLHKILRGGAVAQMAEAIRADPIRVPVADGSFLLDFHKARSITTTTMLWSSVARALAVTCLCACTIVRGI